MRVGDRLGLEAELERHDTVAHPLPGSAQYNVVRLLRGPHTGRRAVSHSRPESADSSTPR